MGRHHTPSKVALYSTVILLLFGVCLLLFEQQIQKDKEPLTVLTSTDSAPFSFYDGKGLAGYDIDLIRLVAQKIHRKIEIIDLPYQALVERMRMYPQCKSDMGITAITPSDFLRKFIDFSVPYHTSRSVLLVPVNSEIASWNAVKNATIGVRSNSVQAVLLRSAITSMDSHVVFVPVSRISSDIRNRLRNGELSGLLLSVEEAQLEVNKNPNLKIIPVPDSDHCYCIAFHKRSPLAPAVNHALRELKKENAFDSLKEKWLSPKSTFLSAAVDKSP